MNQISLEPYLFFKGNCREAMEFYKSIFGGKLEILDADLNQLGNMPNKEWFKGKVMHCSLKGEVNLMASDTPRASEETAKIELSLGGTDETKMREIFNKLAEGGKVKQPLEKQFWGDIYGQLTDKYKIDWMMNIGTEAEK